PNGTEVWYVGEQRDILWYANGTVGNVSIRLWDGAIWHNITNSTQTGSFGYGDGSYNNWPILDLKSESCRINITDVSDAEVWDDSDAVFSIRPFVNVTSPVLGENIHVTNNYTNLIRWNISGTTVTRIDIRYDTENGGGGYPYIIAGYINASLGQYDWNNVPMTPSGQAKIRIIDNSTGSPSADVYGDSAQFNILGKLVLTSPAGGENITILDNTTTINWQGINVTDMRVSYSLNGGQSWNFIKVISDAGNTTTTYWDVNMPEAVVDTARIKINATANEAINDTSANFSLFEQFDVTFPENGTVLVANEVYAVNWTRRSTIALGNVTLWFFNGTGNYSRIFAGNVTNNGTRLWQVPTDVSTNVAKIKVQSPVNSNNWNESFPAFTVRPNVTVTYPNGGEEFSGGQTYAVNWTYLGPVENVTIQYSFNGTAGPWQNLTDSEVAANGTWNWYIDANTTLATTCRIKVYDKDQPLAEDISDANFTPKGALHLDTPNATGLVLNVSDSYNITWTRFGSITFVDLYYSVNGPSGPWTPIVANWSAVTPYPWNIPDSIGNDTNVRVEDSWNPNVWDVADNNFTVIGSISLDAPDIAEPDWIVNTVEQIVWTPTGNFTWVLVEGSTNGFSDENETWVIDPKVANSVSGQPRIYNYTVPLDRVSGTVRVRVSDWARPQLANDTSTDSFKIKGVIVVTSPDSGAEEWTAGNNLSGSPIQWVSQGNIGNVSIACWDGSFLHTVTSSVNGTIGSFSNWTIPDSAARSSKQAWVRITDLDEPSVNDTSNNTFLIKGSVAITHPSGFEAIEVNSSYPINWTKTGVYPGADTVKIQYSTDGGGSWKQCNQTGGGNGDAVDAAQGTFNWLVPDDLSSNARINVTRNLHANVTAISSQIKIIGNITVTNPIQGERWEVNQSYPIEWNIIGSIQNVTVRYSTNNGTNYNVIGYRDGGDGQLLWQVPLDAVTAQARIKISDTSDSSVNDTSDVFTIVPRFVITEPVFGQKYTANRQGFITWDRFGGATSVDLFYSKTNFVEGINASTVIQANVTNNGNYSWQVPDDLNNTVKVAVAWSDDRGVYNISPSCRIVPGYEVVAPYSSLFHKWPVGTVQQIQWNSTSANQPTVKLSYTTDGTNYTNSIDLSANNTGAANATRSYNWTVDDWITAQFRVRVEDGTNADVSATSPSNSKIIGWCDVPAPNATTDVTVGDPFTIVYDHAGSAVTTVNLSISTTNFTNLTVINASSSITGTHHEYPWTVPDMISDFAQIRVRDATDTDADNTSA
ncbi:MAG: hypothetical protein MJA29_02560, partial [Candidatus Omnitrophica bacterium]|nr:hypothetical protein [Candidatus Omnitrophota bacterium]